MNPLFSPKNRILSVISSLIIVTSCSASSEELTNVRIIGGFSAECTATNPGTHASFQPVSFNILSSKKTGSTLNAEFEVQFVECVKGKWQKLKTVKSEFEQSITDELNQNMKERQSFSKWRIQVQNTLGKSIQSIPLSIASGAKFKFKVKIDSLDIQKDSETKSKFVDVIFMADRTKKTSADYFFDEVNWGRVRLTLD